MHNVHVINLAFATSCGLCGLSTSRRPQAQCKYLGNHRYFSPRSIEKKTSKYYLLVCWQGRDCTKAKQSIQLHRRRSVVSSELGQARIRVLYLYPTCTYLRRAKISTTRLAIYGKEKQADAIYVRLYNTYGNPISLQWEEETNVFCVCKSILTQEGIDNYSRLENGKWPGTEI